jgi:hypothetical protein
MPWLIGSDPKRTETERRDRALVAFAMLSGSRDRAIISFRLKHIDIDNDLSSTTRATFAPSGRRLS